MLIENLTNYCDMNYRQKCLNENFDTYNSLTPNWYYKVLR